MALPPRAAGHPRHREDAVGRVERRDLEARAEPKDVRRAVEILDSQPGVDHGRLAFQGLYPHSPSVLGCIHRNQ